MVPQLVPFRSALTSPLAQLGSYLIEMWDAEATTSLTVGGGGAVSAWAGLKASLSVAQAVGGAQPIYSATSFGGGAGVTFDGTDDELTLALAGQLPSGAVAGELWTLSWPTAAVADNTVRHVVAYGSVASNTTRRIARAISNSKIVATGVSGTGAGATQVLSPGRSFSSRSVARWQTNPTVSVLSVDGITDGSLAVVPNTTATRLRFGAGAAGTAANFWQGQIAAVLVTHPLPGGLASALTGYLLRRRRL